LAIIKAHSDFVKQRPDTTTDVEQNALRSIMLITLGVARPSDVPQQLWDEVRQFCKDW